MTRIAPRSSTTARVSRKARSEDGQMGGEDREDGESEGDVGGHRNSPALRATSAELRWWQVEGGGHGHPAHGGDDRQGRGGRGPQFATHQFAFQLDPGDQEEDGRAVRRRSSAPPRGSGRARGCRSGSRGSPRRRRSTGCSPTPAPPRPLPAAPARRPSRCAEPGPPARSGQGSRPRKTKRSRGAAAIGTGLRAIGTMGTRPLRRRPDFPAHRACSGRSGRPLDAFFTP